MPLFRRREKGVAEITKTRRPESTTMRAFEVANLQMLGARERQEDSFAFMNALDVTEIINNGMFAIVADGMGGMSNGKFVSEMAVDRFINVFHSLDRSKDIPTQLYQSVHNVNNTIANTFHGDGGTTVCLVVIYESKAYWMSIGDSAIYLKRGGVLCKLNKEHTYLNKLYAKELNKENINKLRVESDPDKARLSEFLGNDFIGEVDYNKKGLMLQKDDVLLLCTDGISSFIDEADIFKALCFPPTIACEQLTNFIYQKQHPKQDNFTGLVIRCNQ